MRLLLVGDLVLDEPSADFFFERARPTLHQADLVIGHVETPHTARGREAFGDVPAPASPPENIAALARAGFGMASLAGNHIHDRGPEGIEDTVELLNAAGIANAGAGLTLEEARRPAVAPAKGLKVGLLSYNCVGPREGWAGPNHAGCAHIKVISHYEVEGANPGGPAKAYTFCDPDTVEAMQADIEALRAQADIVVCSFHKGLVHTPAALAMYERAAVEAGADIVVGHHAHILRGMETVGGKPVFHGLGNFVTVTRALTPGAQGSPARQAWAERRKILFGFEPDPDYLPLYPFHPESKNAVIADCRFADGRLSAGFLPCWILPTGQPEVLGRDARGTAVRDYVVDITRRAGLKTAFDWDGDRVVFN
jgi:poly-gamma-glutamate capsule biosynthesis protein CapA/YwtB (metallophosphatase superfamily)